jgi:DNA-binding response OmpR family regulator
MGEAIVTLFKPVLVIEDEKRIRDLLQEFLESNGFSVRTAQNGLVGLNLIREMKGRCVVLLDLQMPVMTGEQMMAALTAEADPEVAATPIIIITTSTAPFTGLVSGCIKKPFDLNQVLHTVQLVSSGNPSHLSADSCSQERTEKPTNEKPRRDYNGYTCC